MNVKDKLNQIKTLLGLEVKFAQEQLADGTTVEAEVFAPDYSVGVATEEGIVPMPVGEYEMANGQILVVAQEGIIAEIKEGMQSEEVKEEELSQEAQPTPTKIIETVSKEINFNKQKKMKKAKFKLKFSEEAAEEVVEVSQEILNEITQIINAETPDAVSQEDSQAIAEDVIEAIIEILEEAPEAFSKKKKTEMSAEPQAIVHNPENKKQEPIAYVKRQSLKSEIYKNLFN
jgi:hypothetical protein